MKSKIYILLSFMFLVSVLAMGQGFLHTDGKNIVDGNGENFLIRSIGTGNWMIMEGYMMKSNGPADTHSEFRNKLVETIGTEKTDSFYTAWLHNYMQEEDVDSLASWGFNSIRAALHYKWFTLPIEDEPVPGEQTWLETGFTITDSLLRWCEKNQMYLILDMHGAPGGQGANKDISDYDPTKPSLWEDDRNKDKLVELWMKLAERYSDEPWIGGYDLINETNWSFPENNNIQMRNLFFRLTDSIRQVDPNHMIIIEGNSWANDFSMLFPPWDDNMVYSPHKYWNYNDQGSVQWAINIRNQYNVPIWYGETGENSNTWFTNAITLFESNNIGWSWWPVKKGEINNPFNVKVNEDYYHLIDYWRGSKPKPTEEEAFQAVLTFADNHKHENCIIQWDVIDAMFRQPYTTEIKAYKEHNFLDYIYATDYDLGRNNYAYFDTDTANYSSATSFTAWNNGYAYRNDGVDIQSCSDTDNSNGYNVGWINAGEWLVFSMNSDSATKLDCSFRSSSDAGGGYIQLEANGELLTDEIFLPDTDDWNSWITTTATDIIIPKGNIKLKLKFPFGGFNLSYFRFHNPRAVGTIPFKTMYIETDTREDEFYLHLNKGLDVNEINLNDFQFFINDKETQIQSVEVSDTSDRLLVFATDEILLYNQSLKLSYNGTSVLSNGEQMESFEKRRISNKQEKHFTIPRRIQAEEFLVNSGFSLEECNDTYGGYNTAYADPGDYLDYLFYVKDSGNYKIDFRVAKQSGTARLQLFYEEEPGNFIFLKNVDITSTGGWQTWNTQSDNVVLPEGKYSFRIKSGFGAFNLNWFQFTNITAIDDLTETESTKLYPNPAHHNLYLEFPSSTEGSEKLIEIYDIRGSLIHKEKSYEKRLIIDVSNLDKALYFIKIRSDDYQSYQKFIVN